MDEVGNDAYLSPDSVHLWSTGSSYKQSSDSFTNKHSSENEKNNEPS
jgi:hypothetical protein